MRYLDFRALVIILILNITNNSIFGTNIFTTLMSKPICEMKYRLKYFPNDPMEILSTSIDMSKYEFDDSEFLPIDDVSSGSSEFMIHDRQMWRNSTWKLLERGKIWKKNLLKITNVGLKNLNGRRNNENFNETSRHLDSGWAKSACNFRRVVGGWSPYSAEQIPYLVFIDTGCGGAIISDSWVLSAAHCIDEEQPSYVHAGSLDLLGGCQYGVAGTHLHPSFNRKVLEYDISLLNIYPKFIYSPAISPIKLSNTRARYNMCGIVAGWGAVEYRGPPSLKLLMALIPVIARSKCFMFDIGLGQFCAGYPERKADSCQGDSGGPFVVNNFVVGIVSYGFQCARLGIPGVYVDVFHHRGWIHHVTKIP